MTAPATRSRRSLEAAALIAAYFAIQAVVEIAHEFAHAGTAWLLGYSPTPFTVVWGNPITTKGWDEGVPYDALFPVPGNVAEAAIGGMPLLMHAVLLGICFLVLRRPAAGQGRIAFFGCYLLAVMNLAELVAYIFMRPFIADGDTGRFNEGLAISPWPLFVTGSVLLVAALWFLLHRVGRTLDHMTDGTPFEHRAVAWGAGFIIFLWTSGLRFITLYPDPQWRVGLVGVACFMAWVALDVVTRRAPAAGARTP